MPMTTQMPQVQIMHQPTVLAPTRWSAQWRNLISLAVMCGSLMWMSFFPANQGRLAWIALVPLLFMAGSLHSSRAIYACAFCGGAIYYIIALKWMRVADPMMIAAWIALALYCALYFPIAVWFMRRLRPLQLPAAITFPVIWVSLEYFRSHFLTGFAWYLLGHAQHDYLPLIQSTDLGGVYAVSFLVAAVNGLIFDLLSRTRRAQRSLPLFESPPKQRVIWAATAVGVLFGINLAYGLWRMSQTDFDEGPRVSVLQSNISQDVRNNRSGDDSESLAAFNHMMRDAQILTDEILAERQQPDLIVWPETSFPDDWLTLAAGTPVDEMPPKLPAWIASIENVFVNIAKRSRSQVLLGLNTTQYGPGTHVERYNSALQIDLNGKPLNRYDKIHCVPFGEYVPVRDTLPWMEVFSPYKKEYSLTPGHAMTRFNLSTPRRDYRFGVLICYEDSDPVLARQYVQTDQFGPPVDFLVNISNDGWFKGTEEHESHLAICRFRAIETRRAIVRSVNMGISATIDGNGRVIALPGPNWAESKKVAKTFVVTVPIDSRFSFYAWAGDWLPVGCVFFAACGFAGSILRSRKRPG